MSSSGGACNLTTVISLGEWESDSVTITITLDNQNGSMICL